MSKDEEMAAAEAIGGLITSAMMHAYEEKFQRTFFYIWERDALRWLIRYRERNPGGSVGNDWVSTFMDLNRESILSEGGKIDFDLKSFATRKQKGGAA